MIDVPGGDENPYSPPSALGESADNEAGIARIDDKAALRRFLPAARFLHFLSLIDRATAVLFALCFVGSVATFLINPRGWLSLGPMSVACFGVERYLVIPVLAVLLWKVGRGLRLRTNLARQIQFGLTAFFLVLFVALKRERFLPVSFPSKPLAMWLLAWALILACAATHIATLCLLNTRQFRILTAPQTRNRFASYPGFQVRLNLGLKLACVLLALLTFLFIFFLLQELSFAILEAIEP